MAKHFLYALVFIYLMTPAFAQPVNLNVETAAPVNEVRASEWAKRCWPDEVGIFSCFREYQTFWGALLAITAGVLAFGGSILQARATLRALKQQQSNLERATAAIAWAELNTIADASLGNMQSIRVSTKNFTTKANIRLTPGPTIDSQAWTSNPGNMSPELLRKIADGKWRYLGSEELVKAINQNNTLRDVAALIGVVGAFGHIVTHVIEINEELGPLCGVKSEELKNRQKYLTEEYLKYEPYLRST